MKRIFISCIAAVMSLSLFAQENITVEHNYSAFESVSIGDNVQAELVLSGTPSVKITCDERIEDYIIAYVKDGLLSVSVDVKSMPSDVKKLFKSGTGASAGGESSGIAAPKVAIHTSKVTSLTIDGNNSSISGASAIVSDNLTLTVRKAASIMDLSVKAKTVYMELSQKANVDVTIETEYLNLQANNSSKAEIVLTAKRAVVNAGSFANVEIYGEARSVSLISDSNAKIKFETPSL